MINMESRIQFLKGYIKLLESMPLTNFEVKDIPEEPGLYAIYDENDVLIYIGQTSNLQRRLLRNHRSGNSRGSAFRRALMKDKEFENEKIMSSYIRNNCTFRYLPLQKELSAIEHFLIAVLEPKLNS